MSNSMLTISPSAIVPMVHWIRQEKVILDFDLAALYGVETRALKQAVRRNRGRFPHDFMFELAAEETGVLVSQSVIPSRKKFGGAAPYAFTEQGVAMLSSVLRSPRAVEVNIAIMRTFVQLRRLMDSNHDLAELYGVETSTLNRAVKRNADRFPPDFMLRLTAEEAENLRCQIGISSGWGGRRRSLPHAFTERGATMPARRPPGVSPAAGSIIHNR